MFRLALLMFVVVGTTIAGSLIVAALVAGLDTTVPIVAAAAIGFAVAIPVSYLIARQIA